MGIPAFWASPFPKTLEIWTSPSHITLAFWIRVRVTGDACITRVLGMRMPKMWGCSYHCLNAAFMYDRGTEVQQFRILVMSGIHCQRPWQNKFEQICPEWSSIIAEVWDVSGKYKCSWFSQTNGDIYDFEFSLVGKIWDVRETKKFRIVLDFSDIWKPGFKDSTHLIPAEKF